ncbi:MAG: hypothetical protein KC492_23590, partial [Myxococcales bacterium]|nr:hypothetical protein [Myxococcales bacterium]
MRSAVLGLAVLSLLACSKKEDAEALRPEPSAPISATPSAAPVASATAAAATQEPAAPAVSVASAEPAKVDEPTGDFTPFEGVADAEYFPVGKAVILCEKRCEYPSDPAPKVWLVQAGKLREAPELWPAKAWANLKGIEGEHIVTHVQFSGSYPEVVYAYGAAQADMGEDLLPSATYTAKRWENTPFT